MSESNSTTQEQFALSAPPANLAEERRAKRLAYGKAWREANPGRIKALGKAYRDANKDELIAKRKAYRETNKEALNARMKVYRDANKERFKAYREVNKEAKAARHKVYREANKDKQKLKDTVRRLRMYGLTVEERDEMIRACSGRCPCCGVPFSEILGEQPCVDHDHKVKGSRRSARGIVCKGCNLVLGHAHDNPKILRACAAISSD